MSLPEGNDEKPSAPYATSETPMPPDYPLQGPTHNPVVMGIPVSQPNTDLQVPVSQPNAGPPLPVYQPVPNQSVPAYLPAADQPPTAYTSVPYVPAPYNPPPVTEN